MDSLQVLNYRFNDFLDQGDPRVKNWPMMQTPFPGCVLIAAYIYFVKIGGPRWMKRRPAFELRGLMVFYNFAMVLANLIIFIGIGWFGWFNGYSLKCQPVDYSNSYDAVKMAEMGWWFYITKFIEFADTVFFVLRKKDGQISALHVIHHSIVPFSLWFGLKFAPGGYNAFFPFLNSLVHVIMYTYYGLAALGPRFKKYLGWKKYMTYIQMVQFVGVVIYAFALLYNKCEVSQTFIFVNIVHALLFLGLFYNFFKQSYCRREQPKSSPVLSTHLNGKLCTQDHSVVLRQQLLSISSEHDHVKNTSKNGLKRNGYVKDNFHSPITESVGLSHLRKNGHCNFSKVVDQTLKMNGSRIQNSMTEFLRERNFSISS